MGIFDFFKKNKAIKSLNNSVTVDKNILDLYSDILSFNQQIDKLLKDDCFIARSDYKDLIDKYKDSYESFLLIYKNNVIRDLSRKYKLDIKEISRFAGLYKEIQNLEKGSPTIKAHNESFIKRHLESEKVYLDSILKDCDTSILLDEEQRRVVLSDEDHTLVIAGAGAGKTTTIAAKVKYLVEKQKIKPSQILVISFT